MFHMNWRSITSQQSASDPFAEIEFQMNSFRNSFGMSYLGSDAGSETVQLENEIENMIENSRNMMSMLPVLPRAVRNVPNDNRQTQNRPRRLQRAQNTSQNIFGNANSAGVIESSVQEQRRSRRNNAHLNHADMNSHIFPAPQQDRQVWYEPGEAVPDSRLPHIAPRVLTLAQINRVPTEKVKTTTDGKSCDICLEDFKKGDVKKILNCKHDYHVRCVDPWLKQHTTCPKCRRQVRAPPERERHPPRPVPPPCPIRQRARAYDRDRMMRERNPTQAGSSVQQQDVNPPGHNPAPLSVLEPTNFPGPAVLEPETSSNQEPANSSGLEPSNSSNQ